MLHLTGLALSIQRKLGACSSFEGSESLYPSDASPAA